MNWKIEKGVHKLGTYDNVVSSAPGLIGIWTHNFSNDRHRLHRSNYHLIMTTTPPIYWTCSQSEYRTSNNNQSISIMIGLLNRPRLIMYVIISRTLTRPACHCFTLQGLGYFIPTKKLPWLLKQSFWFTFQMRGYDRFEHQHKSMWGNLQAMTEKGENVKNYQTNKGLLESKLSKYILGDCTFINFMQKIPLILNLCQTIQSATQFLCPCCWNLIYFFFISAKYQQKTHLRSICNCLTGLRSNSWQP